MSNAPSCPIGISRIQATAALITVGLLAMLAAMPTPADPPAPSYAALRPVFQSGAAKQFDEGLPSIYCNLSTVPQGWLWAVDDTRDGHGREYWVLHESFPYPGPDNDGVQMTFSYDIDFEPDGIHDLVEWIVDTYDHVDSADELAIHECKVRLVE